MRAYRLPQPTGPEALTKTKLPAPKPAHGQILVQVRACSLNFRDLAIATGKYRMRSRFPTAPARCSRSAPA